MWLRRMAARRSASIDAVATCPARISPSSTTARWRVRPGRAEVVSMTRGPAGVGLDHAGVADLAAALGVERRDVEEDLDLGRCRCRVVLRRSAGDDSSTRAGGRCCRCSRRTRSGPNVLERAPGRWPGGRRRRRPASFLPCLDCSLLLAMAAAKPSSSTSSAPLGGDLPGQLDREAVGVVQPERHRPGHDRRRRRPARPRAWSARSAGWPGSGPPRGRPRPITKSSLRARSG